jgi:hypothetical protein
MCKLSSIETTWPYLLLERGCAQNFVTKRSFINCLHFTYFTPSLQILLIPLKHSGNEYVSRSVKFKVLSILSTGFIHMLHIILVKIVNYFPKHHYQKLLCNTDGSGFWETITRFLNIGNMKILPHSYSTSVLHPFQHICKLQIRTSKREIPTYNRTYTQQPAVSASFC